MNFVVGSLLRAVIVAQHGRGEDKASGTVPSRRNGSGVCTEAEMRAVEQSFTENYHHGANSSSSRDAAAAAEEAIEVEAFWLLVAMMGTGDRHHSRKESDGSHSIGNGKNEVDSSDVSSSSTINGNQPNSSSSSNRPKSGKSKSNGLDMRSLWRCGVASTVKLRAYQFDRLLKWHLPKLHAHFDAIGLAPEILVRVWRYRYLHTALFIILLHPQVV